MSRKSRKVTLHEVKRADKTTVNVSARLEAATKPKKGYLRSRGWKDLIFLTVVVALGYPLRHFIVPMSDVQKWKARPQLSPRAGAASLQRLGHNGGIPCFFLVPSAAVNQPVVSGTVGDCLMLVPDGRQLELFEVDLWTGDFVPVKTDLYVPDSIPLAFTRTYRPIDDWSRRYHIYLRHVYDPYLFGDRFPYTYLEWRMPDDIHMHYRRVSPGTGYSDAVYEFPWALPNFAGSRIDWNGDGWDLTLEDGTTYLSPEAYSGTRPPQGSLVGIFDKDGNEVRLSRKPDGDLTEVKSPNGRWIRLTYNEGRIVQAKNSSGDVVEYNYDPEGRATTVRYSTGQTTKYAYDSSNRIIEVENPQGVPVLRNSYDSDGRIIEQKLPDGRSYSFRYGPKENGMNVWVEITNPQSRVSRITLLGNSYTIEERSYVSVHR